MFKPYGDVLACVIERDNNGVSLGTSLVRFVIKLFYNNYCRKMLLRFPCLTLTIFLDC